jgi:hypothetical protein
MLVRHGMYRLKASTSEEKARNEGSPRQTSVEATSGRCLLSMSLKFGVYRLASIHQRGHQSGLELFWSASASTWQARMVSAACTIS